MEPRVHWIDRQNVHTTRLHTKPASKPENMFTSATCYVAHLQHA